MTAIGAGVGAAMGGNQTESFMIFGFKVLDWVWVVHVAFKREAGGTNTQNIPKCTPNLLASDPNTARPHHHPNQTP